MPLSISFIREDEYLVNMQHTVIPSWYQREGYISLGPGPCAVELCGPDGRWRHRRRRWCFGSDGWVCVPSCRWLFLRGAWSAGAPPSPLALVPRWPPPFGRPLRGWLGDLRRRSTWAGAGGLPLRFSGGWGLPVVDVGRGVPLPVGAPSVGAAAGRRSCRAAFASFPRASGESFVQYCAGPTTTTLVGVVPLPGGVVVLSWESSSFRLAAAVRFPSSRHCLC